MCEWILVIIFFTVKTILLHLLCFFFNFWIIKVFCTFFFRLKYEKSKQFHLIYTQRIYNAINGFRICESSRKSLTSTTEANAYFVYFFEAINVFFARHFCPKVSQITQKNTFFIANRVDWKNVFAHNFTSYVMQRQQFGRTFYVTQNYCSTWTLAVFGVIIIISFSWWLVRSRWRVFMEAVRLGDLFSYSNEIFCAVFVALDNLYYFQSNENTFFDKI